METFVKVCLKSDWIMYFEEAAFDQLREAKTNKACITLTNLFGTVEVVDGEHIASLFISTVEGRAKYEEFEKMLNAETEQASWES